MRQQTFTILRFSLFALLVAIGAYTLIAYLAVPVHQAGLLSESTRSEVLAACPTGGVFCMGLSAFLPFLSHAFSQMSPIAWYGIISVIVLFGFWIVEFMRSEKWQYNIKMTPLRILIGFFVALWVMFTVISFGTSDGTPYTRLYEPLPQVYVNAEPEALAALEQNIDHLESRNCLRVDGMTNHGAKIYSLKHWCMQTSFITRVASQAVAALYFLFVLIVLGRALLRLLRVPHKNMLSELVFSAGIGAGGLIVVLWLLALLSVYNVYVGWILLLVIPMGLFKDSLYWLRALVEREWNVSGPWYLGAPILFWLLISLLALNFLNVIRPFPIGWDDLGKYINQPRLLVSYGEFIPQLASFLWEYLTSLGFLLFGYTNTFGATLAMVINWSAGLLATLSVYAFGRLYLGKMQGLLAAFLYYVTPVVGHFSFADMKVDNAVFFMGTLTVLAVFIALFPIAEDDTENNEEGIIPSAKVNVRWFILAGVLGGLAFSLKPTTVMVLMALGTMLFGVMVHWTAFVGTAFLGWAMYTYQDRFNLREISERVYGDPSILSKPVILFIVAAIGVVCTAYAFYTYRPLLKRAFIAAGIFIATFVVTIAPWLAYNNIHYGNIIPRLAFTAPNDISPTFMIDDTDPIDYGQEIRRLPEELQVDTAQCVGSAKTEELDRYWGYGSGWSHYLTLPWRTVMNLDSAGYYVTTYPALLLIVLLLLVPFFWMKQARWLRWLFIGTLFMVLQWMFFANGIIWYGIGMFLGLTIGLEALVFRAPDTPSKVTAALFVGLSILTALSMRFWQFDQQRNLFEYPLGKVQASVIQERTIPYYDNIVATMEQRSKDMPERPYTYRMGTFITYFVPQNLEALPVADHQLDLFNCLYQERDGELTLKRLQALGFNAMIFDTNTQTIERDPNGSLHKKVEQFVDFVNTPGLGIQSAVNSPETGIAYILLP